MQVLLTRRWCNNSAYTQTYAGKVSATMLDSRSKPLLLLVLHIMISTVLSSHFCGGIIMVRSVIDNDSPGSGEGSDQPPVVMPVREYNVSNSVCILQKIFFVQLN